ncbi:hypothetical protein [Plantibacter sp. YIM 135347]|uniref:hypothetical protein n=1 Tax=Plantibacter sp. YIM 135347 TaxID=3423919 RepID=UPI003D34A52B
MTNTAAKSFSRLAALAAVPLLALTLVACGADGGDDVAAPKATESAKMTADEWHLALAQCMRGEGVDYPDPVKGQGPSFDDSDSFKAAFETCGEKLGPSPSSVGAEVNDPAMRELSLKTAKCLRDQGVDVPDPQEGGFLDVPSDASDEALEACGYGGGSRGVTVQR